MKINAVLKIGIVKESKPGFARVNLPECETPSQWLPIAVPRAHQSRAVWTYAVGEQVACLLDDRWEEGVVVGAIYSDVDTPPTSNPKAFRWQFADGGVFEYDEANGKLTITTIGDADITVGGKLTAQVTGDADISASNINLTATKVKIAAANTEATGNLKVGGLLSYGGGLEGLGTGAGAAAKIGAIDAQSIKSATPIEDGHKHTDSLGGTTSTPK